VKTKHRIYSYIVLLIIIISTYFLLPFFFPSIKLFSSPEFIRKFVLSFGPISFLVYILLVAMAVPLPIPSTAVILAGGYIFGTFTGSILALISIVIGSIITFLLARKVGISLIQKITDKKHLDHWETLFKKKGITLALIAYIIPIFPSDFVSLVLGLTKIKFKTFFFIVLVGFIPRVIIINTLGDFLHNGISFEILILVIVAFIFALIAIFRHKLRIFFFKELKVVKKEVKVAEKKIGL
jgi:uncharacterized membrane protein YdjX (TVP38/TMEM64 family)